MEWRNDGKGVEMKPKKKKFNQTGVWACPRCWKKIDMLYNEKQEKVYLFKCCYVGYFSAKLIKINNNKPIYFDSQAEYAYALKLKEMEKRGLIRDLIHHPRVELAPAIYYLQKAGKYTPLADHNVAKKYPEYCAKVHDKLTYEADFQYTDDTGIHFVEVKALSRKGVPFIHGIAKFRHKIELLKAVHGIDLEIMTGNARWRFNGKKLEVSNG